MQDIESAPRNARGNVEYGLTFSVLKPVDLARSNHTLVYDVVNRGNKLITSFLNVGITTTNPAGDGFLQKQGFVLVWSGWQGDALAGGGRQVMTVVPVARRRDGSSITGEVRQEYTPGAAVPSEPLAGNALTAPIETATLDNSTATLTRRIHWNDPKELVPRSQWAFADCSATNPFPGTPSTTRVCLQGGFDTNHIYELVYTGKGPKVLGIGFAATRDLVAFLRRNSGASNPLAGAVHSTIGFGISQSGRFLRTFTGLGFNEDENGKRVFDGLDPDIASYRISLNIRFAQPTRLAGTQHTEKQFPGQEAPTTWGDSHDRFAHIDGGLLDRCRRSNTCPKVFNTVSSTEYWQAGMSFTTADADADEDLVVPENVRIYHFASAQHGGSAPAVAPSQNPVCEQLGVEHAQGQFRQSRLVRPVGTVHPLRGAQGRSQGRSAPLRRGALWIKERIHGACDGGGGGSGGRRPAVARRRRDHHHAGDGQEHRPAVVREVRVNARSATHPVAVSLPPPSLRRTPRSQASPPSRCPAARSRSRWSPPCRARPPPGPDAACSGRLRRPRADPGRRLSAPSRAAPGCDATRAA